MAKKRKHKNHDDELHVLHPDEKWLVSYADMMTLLFGFFVLLFSLAVKNKGDFKSGLKEISKEMDQKKQEVKPISNVTDTVLLVELKKVQAEKEKAILDAEEAKKKLDQLKNNLSVFEIKEIENQAIIEKKEADINQLKIFIEQMKVLKDVKANDTEKLDLNKEFKQALQKISELEKLLTDLRNRNYMMAFIKWDTEKHDIDMTLKDPAGHIFDFKRRTYPNVSGNLILDSRYGPGVEVWNSSKVVSGDYEITAILYNHFGNLNDAVITGSIVTGYGLVELPKSNLNMKDRPNVTFKFNVSAEGKVVLK